MVELIGRIGALGPITDRPLTRTVWRHILFSMTLHSPSTKKSVGIRELHDQLSRYVRHAADGGEVVVTMRGTPVARLSPVGATDPLLDLKARGLIREPTRDWSPRKTGRPRPRGGTVSELVKSQRR